MVNTNYSLLSLNVRGLGNPIKRKSVFRWLKRSRYDVVMLQETHSTVQTESAWKPDWPGPAFFAHGSSNSKGCCILVREEVDFKPVSIKADRDGRFLIMKCKITSDPVTIVNVYAPNKDLEYVEFMHNLDDTLSMIDVSNLNDIIIGGDWNVVRNDELDKLGGSITLKPNGNNCIEMLMSKFNLNDVWRIKNPQVKRYSWRQCNPLIQCRLDYWLISDSMFDKVTNADIIPSIRSDHSAITLEFQNIPNLRKGPSFWKFNCSLLSDVNYVTEMRNKLREWIDNDETDDEQLKWELLKYKIRKFTCNFSKRKKDETLQRQKTLEHELCELERNLMKERDISRYKEVKNELEKIDDEKIKGAIIRSKVQWYEEGEKSTKYFLGLEKNRSIKKHVQKLTLSNGETTTCPKEIMNIATSYYRDLYSYKHSNFDCDSEKIFEHIKTLDNVDQEECEGNITTQECLNVINKLSKNKSPGNDGINAEFYSFFWPEISECFVASFNAGLHKGELSSSQRQAVITLIDKGKDRAFIENWRPISLLNVDYKIASKVIAQRIDDKIPKLIELTQTGFVKGRYMADTIRSVHDIIEYSQLTNNGGLLMMIDFKKAFDTLNRNFMFEVLQKMNFGPSFISWIKLFYNNIESCISNNGTSSSYFPLKRGVRQGDPLSSYLFILCAEILSNAIIHNDSIKGIEINKQAIKLLQYADDTTAVLKNEQSVKTFLDELRTFSSISGLELNTTKTEAMWLGVDPPFMLPYNIKWSYKPIKMLGVYVGWNLSEAINLSFSEKIINIKKLLLSWQHRKLTLNGKILILKSLALSQITHLLNVLPFPNVFMKELENLFYNFVWNGKTNKVKKSVFIQDFRCGGHKMIDIQSVNQTQKLKWVKLYLNNHRCLWRPLMEEMIRVENLNMFLRGNFDKCPTHTKSKFYQEVIQSLYTLNDRNEQNKKENLLNQYVFYNRRVKVNKKTVYDKELFTAGIWRICDLFNHDGTTIPFSVWKRRGVTNTKFLVWRGLLSCVKEFVIDMQNVTMINSSKQIILPTNDIIDLQHSNSNDVYCKIVKLKLEKPTALTYYLKQFTCLDDNEIGNMYILPRMCTSDMAIKEFQYKILHRYLPTNDLLYKMKLVSGNKCTFCNMYNENVIHLFFECTYVKQLLFKVQDIICIVDNLGNEFRFTTKDVILGYKLSQLNVSSLTINNLLLHFKMYIWKCKIIFVEPTYAKFKEYVESVKDLDSKLLYYYNEM